jgi:hypothetical protein
MTQAPPARKPFRQLAAVLAVLLVALAGVFGWIRDDGWITGVGIFLFLGVVMATIAATGYWPKPR